MVSSGPLQIICTSLQTDNHANTSSLNFYRPDALPDSWPTVSKHWRQLENKKTHQEVRRQTSSSTTFTQCTPEATEFGEIAQNNCHYAVQGHSRSPILVPIEKSYTTSCYWLILTYLLSCTVWPSIGPKWLYLATPLAFNSPDGGAPLGQSP